MSNNSVLFIIDIQTAFQNAIYRFNLMSNTSNLLLRSSSVLNFPVVVTEQYPKGLGHTIKELDISGDNVKVFEKTLFSALTPEVSGHLSSLNLGDKPNALVCGIEGHVCVLQTCFDLLEKDWNVHIIADGVSSSSHLERSVALDRLRNAGCYVSTAESVLFQIMGDSKHENFKQISSLLKERNRTRKQNSETF